MAIIYIVMKEKLKRTLKSVFCSLMHVCDDYICRKVSFSNNLRKNIFEVQWWGIALLTIYKEIHTQTNNWWSKYLILWWTQIYKINAIET